MLKFARNLLQIKSPRTSADEGVSTASLGRLVLDDDDVACLPIPDEERPSRILRVSGMDGVEVEVQVHSRDSIGMIKTRISAAMGVHEDLQEVFDSNAESPFKDCDELPEDTAELTLLHKTPELYKVTPGPPLNCRKMPKRDAKVVTTFQPGDILKVIGERVQGGEYAEKHNLWLPVLVETKKESEPIKANDQPEVEAKMDENDDQGVVLTKAWCACGSDEDAYLDTLSVHEQDEYYLRG